MAATEPPTARRIREARQQGKVPRSEAVAPGVLCVVALAWLAARGEALWAALESWLSGRLAAVGRASSLADPLGLLRLPVAPLLSTAAAVLLLVLAVQLAQVGLVWAHRAPAGPLRPWLPGWLTGLLLSAVVVGTALLGFRQALDVPWLAPGAPDASLAGVLGGCALALGLGTALVVAIDVVRSRAAYLQQLRMQRHEVERERRESEGPREPRRRQRRLLRAGGRPSA